MDKRLLCSLLPIFLFLVHLISFHILYYLLIFSGSVYVQNLDRTFDDSRTIWN